MGPRTAAGARDSGKQGRLAAVRLQNRKQKRIGAQCRFPQVRDVTRWLLQGRRATQDEANGPDSALRVHTPS